MKQCPICQNQLDDSAQFCPNCGTQFGGAQPQFNGQYGAPQQPVYAPVYDPYDHTAEFDAKDISDNKVICMLVYIMGVVGIIIALLASSTSKYTAFHVRQALKFTVAQILMWIVAILTCWLFFIPVAVAGIMTVVLNVIKIICFFQICSGKAKEPAIIRSLKFMK